MAASLQVRDIKVTILTTDDDGDGRDLAFLPPADSGSGINLIVKPRTTKFYITSWSAAVWLWRNVRAFDAVHVHALFSFMPVVAALVARWRGVAFIIRPLGTLGQYGLSERRPLLKRLSLRWLERPLLRAASAVHCTSLAEAAEVRASCNAARTVVIPLSVPAFKPANRDAVSALRAETGDGLVVLFLSRLDPKKNIETLLQSVGLVLANCPNAIFLIAGTGDQLYEKTLHDLAESLGVGRRVRWIGNVEGTRKAAAFSIASVFVLPSFDENFGIAVAEALAAGVPCVVTPGVAIAAEIEAASAGVVVKCDAQSVAVGIVRYLQSGELRVRASEAARALAFREYGREKLGDRLLRLYQDVRNGRISAGVDGDARKDASA